MNRNEITVTKKRKFSVVGDSGQMLMYSGKTGDEASTLTYTFLSPPFKNLLTSLSLLTFSLLLVTMY
jgi:hypothetical protein